ncbi:MAG: bifunctional folylpolyglutamate synthase/dihydrofolate synthase [Desulfosudaceae bacterium]
MSQSPRYDQCLTEMYGLRRFGIQLELETIAAILAGLGQPQNRFRSIHLAGTNGKGSIAAMLSAIFHAAGYRVGRYTSPHLIRFNERITINEQPVSDEAVVTAYEAVRGRHGNGRQPTFFEYTTAMAFHEFARQQVDLAVIETGMGGRYDATNVISPELCLISNISLEHQLYLGSTLAAIAREKAGIIKPGIPLVTGVSQKSARQVIAAATKANRAPLYIRGPHFKTRRNSASDRFTYYGLAAVYRDLQTSLAGRHQQVNASLALAACEVLTQRGWKIPEEAIRRGLAATRWPARLETISRNPLVLIDGAHNLMAATSLAQYLRLHLDDTPLTLIIGILDDKAYAVILQTLAPFCRRIIVTRAETGRAVPPDTLAAAARQLTDTVAVTRSVEAAIDLALADLPPKEVLCIAGSLYVAGEARAVFIKKGWIRE